VKSGKNKPVLTRMSFVLKNNTNEMITVDLQKSFLIINDFAICYFQNKSFSTTSGTQSGVVVDISDGETKAATNFFDLNSVIKTRKNEFTEIYNEISKISIPPKSSKIIAKYKINNDLYENCNLKKFPDGDKTEALEFNFNTSPFRFSNYLTLYFENQNLKKSYKHDFFVSKVQNLHYDDVIEYEYKDDCGNELLKPRMKFINANSNQFFIVYEKNRKDK
jgi:hypothetical protein